MKPYLWVAKWEDEDGTEMFEGPCAVWAKDEKEAHTKAVLGWTSSEWNAKPNTLEVVVRPF